MSIHVHTSLACGSSQCIAKIVGVISRAKFWAVLIVTIVVPTGLLFSQLCALNCALNSCSAAAIATTSPQNSESSACHHHGDKKESTPQPENDKQPDRCPGHVEANAGLPSVIGSLSALDRHAQPLAGPQLVTHIPYDNQNGGFACDAPFRAPPARAVTSALRI
jgi:hypothetical protein